MEVRLILLIRSMITDRIGHYKKSCNQLIKTMTKFEKETRLKQLTLWNARQQLVHTHIMFCPLTQVWWVNYHSNCPITPSNYKHDPYTVLLALRWQLVSGRPGFESYQSLQLFSNLFSAVTLIAAHLQASFSLFVKCFISSSNQTNLVSNSWAINVNVQRSWNSHFTDTSIKFFLLSHENSSR